MQPVIPSARSHPNTTGHSSRHSRSHGTEPWGDDHMNISLTYNKTLRLKTMTFQSNLGTSLLPEREPVRVTLALLSSPPSALFPASKL